MSLAEIFYVGWRTTLPKLIVFLLRILHKGKASSDGIFSIEFVLAQLSTETVGTVQKHNTTSTGRISYKAFGIRSIEGYLESITCSLSAYISSTLYQHLKPVQNSKTRDRIEQSDFYPPSSTRTNTKPNETPNPANAYEAIVDPTLC